MPWEGVKPFFFAFFSYGYLYKKNIFWYLQHKVRKSQEVSGLDRPNIFLLMRKKPHGGNDRPLSQDSEGSYSAPHSGSGGAETDLNPGVLRQIWIRGS